ncbi:hypothetical protein BGZ98_000657 [Dissophora globulifera]|nr:hypothetical protein BGZ98_000657 [Dissophora globulifera]
MDDTRQRHHQHQHQQQQNRNQDLADRRELVLQELRGHVASYMSRQDIGACRFVSRQWFADWNPLYWREIRGIWPPALNRHANFIRELEVRGRSSDKPISVIRDHCHNLRSLKLAARKMTVAECKQHILGLQGQEQEQEQEKRDQNQSTRNLLPIDKMDTPLKLNGFCSNTLRLLELLLPPEVCDIVFPWLLCVKKTSGQLQGLRSFCLGETIITYTCMNRPEPAHCTLMLSQVLEFLNRLPSLTTFSTCDLEIIDDLEANSAPNTLLPPTSSISISDQKPRDAYRLDSLEISPQQVSVLDHLVTRMPHLQSLEVYLTGDIDLISHIPRHCPQLTSLALDMYGYNRTVTCLEPDDLRRQAAVFHDWIQLFRGLSRLKTFYARCLMLPELVLKAMAESCPDLQEFLADGDTETSVAGVVFLLKKCRALKRLTLLQSYDIELFGYGNRSSDTISDVLITATGATITTETPFNGHLRTLTEEGHGAESDQGFMEPWVAPLEHLMLDSVRIKNDKEIDIFRRRLHQLTLLKSLKIEYAYDITIRAFVEPEHEHRIVETGRVIDLKDIDTVLKPPSTRPDDEFNSGRFQHLEVLMLGCRINHSEDALSQLIDMMPRLRSMDFDCQRGCECERILRAKGRTPSP